MADIIIVTDEMRFFLGEARQLESNLLGSFREQAASI